MAPPNQTDSQTPSSAADSNGTPRKGWLSYVPLAVAVFLILLPHPSFAVVLASHYLRTRHSPLLFCVHILAVYSFTFLAFTSLIICVVRDPGPVAPAKPRRSATNVTAKRGGHRSAWLDDQHDPSVHSDQAMTALLQDVRNHPEDGGEDGNYNEEAEGQEQEEGNCVDDLRIDVDQLALDGRWCERCYQPRPERAHHCSTCGRCVLKMDHHCPWLGSNCIGHRTYPAFVHFIFSTMTLAVYITCVALSVTVRLVSDPFSIDPHVSPLHALFLLLMGAIFSLTMASFLIYHIYLISTNQTTLEHISPYLLLRHIPPPPTHLHVPLPQPQSLPHPNRHVSPPPSSPRTRPLAYQDAPLSPVSRSPSDSTLSPSYHHPLFHPTPLVPASETNHNNDAAPHIPDTIMHASVRDHSGAGSRTPVHDPTPAVRPSLPSTRDLPYRPPEEHELSSAQRRLVRHMHGQIRLYNLGWRRNWEEVFGGRCLGPWEESRWSQRKWQKARRWGWWLLGVVLCGGCPKGEGRVFERGKGVGAALERLRRSLEDVERADREAQGWD